MFIDRNAALYFDSFGIEYISQEVLSRLKDKSITHNVFRIQDNASITCGFYCIAFTEYVLSGKILFNYTHLQHFPNDAFQSYYDLFQVQWLLQS